MDPSGSDVFTNPCGYGCLSSLLVRIPTGSPVFSNRRVPVENRGLPTRAAVSLQAAGPYG